MTNATASPGSNGFTRVKGYRMSAESVFFDATSGRWAKKKPMPEPAHHVMAAAVNSKIYVFGGFVSPTGGGEAAEGGWQPTSASWVYDPQSDAWTALAPMPTPRGAGCRCQRPTTFEASSTATQ